MKRITFLTVSAIGFVFASGIAQASQGADQAAALGGCRAAIASKLNVPATRAAIGMDRIQIRPRLVKADFSIPQAGGPDAKARCGFDLRAGKVSALAIAADGRTFADATQAEAVQPVAAAAEAAAPSQQ